MGDRWVSDSTIAAHSAPAAVSGSDSADPSSKSAPIALMLQHGFRPPPCSACSNSRVSSSSTSTWPSPSRVSRVAGAADASPLLDPDQHPLREDPPACWYAGQCTCDQGHASAMGGNDGVSRLHDSSRRMERRIGLHLHSIKQSHLDRADRRWPTEDGQCLISFNIEGADMARGAEQDWS